MNRWRLGEVIEQVATMAERTGVVVVVTDWTLKSIKRNGARDQRYPGGFDGPSGASRAIFIAARDPELPRRLVLFHVKATNTELKPPVGFVLSDFSYTVGDKTDTSAMLVCQGESEDFPDIYRFLSGATQDGAGRPAHERLAARAWLTAYLYGADNYEMQKAAIEEDARRAGHMFKTLDRAARELGITAPRYRFQRDGMWWWKLPPDVIDIIDQSEASED